jgi:hypothetical protein
MKRNLRTKHISDKAIWVLVIGMWMMGCTQQPQEVRRLHEQQELDSATIEQLEFNMHMASAADKECSAIVTRDSLTYAMDDFGFWYCKTINLYADSLQQGEQVAVHIQMIETNGKMIADIKDNFTIGSGDLPLVFNRCLKQMSRGEQMRIIAPWYTAYGAEGTTRIKPYTNLIITLSINNE